MVGGGIGCGGGGGEGGNLLAGNRETNRKAYEPCFP